MKKAERYYGATGSAMVYASDYDALMAERDELLVALVDVYEHPNNLDLRRLAGAIIAKCRGDL
jgi:hypothetical protein